MTKIRTTSFEMKGDYISCNAITLHEDALQDAIVRGMQQVFNTEDSVYRELMPKGFAAFMIGHMYFAGEGTKQDYDNAFMYFSEALRMGEKHALEPLSFCYEQGLGTKKNTMKAEKLKRQVAEVSDDVDYNEILLSYARDEI